MEIQLRKQAGNMGDFAENKLRAPGEVGFWGWGWGEAHDGNHDLSLSQLKGCTE